MSSHKGRITTRMMLKDDLTIKCKKCERRFKHKQGMFTHMRVMHKIDPDPNKKRNRDSIEIEKCRIEKKENRTVMVSGLEKKEHRTAVVSELGK